jgi:serine/threonine protein kinase
VVRLHCIIPSSHGLYLVLEYGGCDLAYQFDCQSLRLKEAEIKAVMRQLLSGLAFLHQHQVIHRDLKLSNILLDKTRRVRICDFGLSRFANSVMTSGVVTLWYRAPEVLLGAKDYSWAVDMWSVGCIFAELLNNGSPVLPGKTAVHQLQLICKLIGPPGVQIWPEFSRFAHRFRVPEESFNTLRVTFARYSQECVDFLNSLLVWDPAERLSAAEALLSSYLQ